MGQTQQILPPSLPLLPPPPPPPPLRLPPSLSHALAMAKGSKKECAEDEISKQEK